MIGKLDDFQYFSPMSCEGEDASHIINTHNKPRSHLIHLLLIHCS